MQISRAALAATILMLSAALAGCSDSGTGPNATTGTIAVALDMTGDTRDPDGCSIAIDNGDAQPAVAGDRVLFTGLEPGSHVVRLSGMETYCTLNGENPVVVRAAAGDTTEVSFALTCGDPTPTFSVAGMEVLGSGYNIGGGYADVADVRAHVLNLAALQGDGLLRQVQYERASYQVVSGQTSRDYLSNLQVKVGVAGQGFGFSGSLKAAYSQERYGSQHYAFATVQSVIRKHGLRVAESVSPEQLRSYLAPAAAAAINNAAVAPVDLFATFGTHVLRGIIVGGRLDFTTSANMSFESQSRSIDVYARASFKSLFASASIETQVIDQESRSEFSATEETHLEVYGGRSEYGQYIVNQGQYENWVESVNDNAVFMDFESTGLVGIWELASDPARRAAIRSAFDAYAMANGISLAAAGTIVSNFADDDEGWKFFNTAGVLGTPVHAVSGGFFGGYVVGSEGNVGSQDAPGGLDFLAPSKFLGNKTPYAGGTLEYYLWFSPDPWDLFNPPVVRNGVTYFVLVLSENGNLRYGPDNADGVTNPVDRPGNYYPVRAPKRFVIPLRAGDLGGAGDTVTGTWYRWDGTRASDADIFMSLAAVRAIRIWGDFLQVEDHMALDGVALRAP
jgi:hypothetical protein